MRGQGLRAASEDNADGTTTYYGAAGDFNLGEAGRSAIDVYKVTLPPAPKVPGGGAEGPGTGPGSGDGRCVQALRGTKAPDELTGSIAGDRIKGRGGDDTIKARSGDDCVNGGGGNDRRPTHQHGAPDAGASWPPRRPSPHRATTHSPRPCPSAPPPSFEN